MFFIKTGKNSIFPINYLFSYCFVTCSAMAEKIPSGLIDELRVNLLHTGFAALGQEWNYSNIVSPFTRIYLITKGEGFILPNNVMYQLKPGYLYLIPSFVLCNYHCTGFLSQFYIHLTNQFPTGLNIYDFYLVQNELKAFPFDIHLFKRLLELNKEAALQQIDPKTYEKENWKTIVNHSRETKTHLETIGILKQLLSRFIIEPKVEAKNLQQFCDFRKVFQYINANLHREIRVETLAELANYSYDHFTRMFKKTTGMLPVKYINMKKIEKTQILLLTTNLSQSEICFESGFNHLPYYYKVFKNLVGCTPSKYRRMGGLV